MADAWAQCAAHPCASAFVGVVLVVPRSLRLFDAPAIALNPPDGRVLTLWRSRGRNAWALLRLYPILFPDHHPSPSRRHVRLVGPRSPAIACNRRVQSPRLLHAVAGFLPHLRPTRRGRRAELPCVAVEDPPKKVQ